MECINHPGKAAIGTCIICSRPFCSACAIEMPDGSLFCYPDMACGNALVNTGPSRMSILALILSLIGLTTGVTGLVGAIIGFMELGKVKRGESTAESRKYARAAIIVGLITSAILFLYFMFLILIQVLAALSSR